MQRRSYYPHNQHLVSTATGTSSGVASSRPTTPANDLRVDGGVTINSNSMDINGPEVDGIRHDKDTMVSEKEYR